MDFFGTPKNQKNDDLEVTGISRSGRVRKKSSKLVDFESPDDFTEHKLKKQKAQQQAHQLHAQQLLEKYEQQLQQQKYQSVNNLHQTNSIHQGSIFQNRKLPESNVIQIKHEIKQEIKNDSTSENEDESSDSGSESANGIDSIDNYGRSSMDSMSDDEVDPLMLDDVETEVESPGFTKLEPPEQTEIPSQAKSSLYMLEKYKKKIIIKDGKVINKPMKTQRKDKGKTRFTAYMLWSKEVRQQLVEHHPELDFASISKKLGELWATVPNLEKYNWRKRAKRLALKPPVNNIKNDKESHQVIRKFINKSGSRELISPKKTIQLGNPIIGNKVPVSPPLNKERDLFNEPFLGTGMYKVTGTQPIDIAAHLTLLGESLSIIGKRLKEHEGQITVSGSLSLLLDSLLCALGPLLCLTQQIPAMNGADPENLSTILENLAYIMPGL